MDLIIKYFLSFMAAFGLSAIAIPLVILFCNKYKCYDKIDDRKNHKKEVGRLGGIGIIFSFSVIFNFLIREYLHPDISLNLISLSFLLIFGMGLMDDLLGMRARYKFLVQIIAAILTVYAGVRIPIAGVFGTFMGLSGFIDSFLTVIWILAFMNAVNLIDGMDGLSSGLAMIALFFFAAVGIHSGNTPLVMMSLALMGSIAGFYIFNFPPAKIFLGDAGAYSIGFLLAVIFPISFNAVISLKLTFVPAIIFSIPFLDVGQVMTRRLWLRTGLFTADNNHTHHKLLAAGYSRKHVLSIIYAIAVCFGCLGVLLWVGTSVSCIYILIITLIFMSILLFKLSEIDDRTRKLSSIADPGFKWWKQSLRFFAKEVSAIILNVNGEKKPLTGFIFDISPAGFFYSTEAILSAGDRILISLEFNDRKPLKLTAEVVWINNNKDKLPAGFGCRFRGINNFACNTIKYHLLSNKAIVRKRIKKSEDKKPIELRVISGGVIQG